MAESSEDADGGELSPDGRVMEMLSEHTLLGWLEGYLLTGRHGLFHLQAFAHVVDSMVNQHAKRLDISKNHVPWRARSRPRYPALLDGLAADHNGFSHRPGFHRPRHEQGALGRHITPAGRQHPASVADHRLRSRTTST